MAALALLLCSSCGNDQPSPAPTAPSDLVRSVAVVLAAVNPGYQASAVAGLADGGTRDVTTEATWTSSNPNVATVTPQGRVTTLATGTAEILATYQTITGRAF